MAQYDNLVGRSVIPTQCFRSYFVLVLPGHPVKLLRTIPGCDTVRSILTTTMAASLMEEAQGEDICDLRLAVSQPQANRMILAAAQDEGETASEAVVSGTRRMWYWCAFKAATLMIPYYHIYSI